MPDNPNTIAPYSYWSTAATNIQDAVDIAQSSDTILVADGVYNSDGRAYASSPAMTNRVCITDAITLKSVNGPSKTVIEGKGPKGNGAIRGVFMVNNTVVSGFTITNGFSLTTGSNTYEESAGGVFMKSGGMLTNCVVTHCSSDYDAGGVYGDVPCIVKTFLQSLRLIY